MAGPKRSLDSGAGPNEGCGCFRSNNRKPYVGSAKVDATPPNNMVFCSTRLLELTCHDSGQENRGNPIRLQPTAFLTIAGRMTFLDRQRFAGALTHPVTIAALVMLMVNDLLFKALWPGSWTTGKLSDLAWMAFAPPLLAFLLSLAAPRKPGWDRAIFIAAYVGLPLLYLAYNTLEPLHDGVIGVFMLANRGDYGSPFDPTDSLVIPAGIAIAFWVLRNGSAASGSLADHGKFLVAGLACFAMVATSQWEPKQGITMVGIEQDGNKVVATSFPYGYTVGYQYVSHDGGWEWEYSDSKGDVSWGAETVATPRGTFYLDGLNILHSADGETGTVSFSLERLDTEGNAWIFRKDAEQFHNDSPSLLPHNLVYHRSSDNVIVAWGLQGVLVNDSSGQWHKIAVGGYSPVDFSFAGKSGVLFSDVGYWFAMMALSMSSLALALALARFLGQELVQGLANALVLAVLAVVACFLLYLGIFLSQSVGLVGIIVLIALIGGAIGLGFLVLDKWWGRVTALALSFPALVGAALSVWSFGLQDGGYYFSPLYIVAPITLLFALFSLLVSARSFKHWAVIVPAFLGVNLLITLAFSWWLYLGLMLPFAKLAAVALAALWTVALAMYLKKKERDEADWPSPLTLT